MSTASSAHEPVESRHDESGNQIQHETGLPADSDHAPYPSTKNANTAPTKEEPSGSDEAPTKAPAKEKKKPFTFDWGAWIFTILFFCSFAFVITGISIGQFMERGGDSCVSIWGVKPVCFQTHYNSINWTEWPGNYTELCEKGDSLMQAAQAFSIMSVIGALFGVLVGILEIIKFADLKIVGAIVACIGTVATLVTWCTMMAMYWANLCGRKVFADTHSIGPGLILYITAWCVQMVAVFILILSAFV